MKRAGKRGSLMAAENRVWKLMIAPSLLLLILMSIYPMVFNV